MRPTEPLDVRVQATLGRKTLDVSLACRGTWVLVGPNGAGKSSLLGAVLGALPLEQGRITLGEQVLRDVAHGIDVPLERRRLGYVPQDYALFPHLDVRENVAFAVASAHPALSRGAAREKVDAALSRLGLDACAAQDVRRLSGGERQRVALARALAGSPQALLLDEPLAALDVPARREVRAFLAEFLQRLALPTLLVTHDAADARQLADAIAVLEQGRLTQTGTWDELVAAPRTGFVEALVRGSAGEVSTQGGGKAER